MRRRGIAGVLLAAGAGSRFAGPDHKLRSEVRGRPLVSWQLDAMAAAGFDRCFVVTGAVDLSDLVPDGVTEVHHAGWADGQAGSLQAGITAVREAELGAAVVGVADTPGVTVAAWRVVGASAGPIVVASFDGAHRPPVKLESEVFDLLPTDGDEGARALLRDRPDLVSAVPCPGDPSDIDTEEDRNRWS